MACFRHVRGVERPLNRDGLAGAFIFLAARCGKANDMTTDSNKSADTTGAGETPETTKVSLEQLQAELQSAQKRIKELNAESAKHRKEADDAAKAKADAEAKALAEQGNFKTLYEKAQADLQAEKQAKAAIELSLKRERIAQEVGLPALLAERLRGETDEELRADAKALLGVAKGAMPTHAGGTDSNSGRGNATGTDITAEVVQRKAGDGGYRIF